MKTWKLVSGILSIVLSGFVFFQSGIVGLGNALTDNGETSGMAGFVVGSMLLSEEILSIVSIIHYILPNNLIYKYNDFS